MGEVVLLGTARALPTISQENTYMALVSSSHFILIDCAGSPYRRLLRAGLDPAQLVAMILTHSHPDHVYGVPVLLMGLWLAGRRTPLDVYAPTDTCDLVRDTFARYRPEDWPGMFPVVYHNVPPQPGALVCRSENFEIVAAPVEHMLPTIGLRITDRQSGRVLAYSGDTEPGAGVRFLAQGASLLLHEASGGWAGHSSPAQAGAVAEEAGAERLVLVHYDAQATPPEEVERDARSRFTGPVQAARDFDRFTW